MRYPLLASAGLVAVSAAFAILTPASAEDCGCRDSVRAALAKQAPAVQRAPLPAVTPQPRRTAARVARRTTDCNCGPAARPAPAAASGASFYDYGASAAVNISPYTHHWTVAPQGYVPPPPMAMSAPMVPGYDGPAELPPYGPEGATAYSAGGYDESYAYGPAPAYGQAPVITVEQQGWFGGVGYGAYGGGGGGGGGGMTLTLSQPDAGNGPSYNSFGQSYGGDYQSAGQVNQFRAQAFAPKPASGSK